MRESEISAGLQIAIPEPMRKSEASASFWATYAFVGRMNAFSGWTQWTVPRIRLKICKPRRLFQVSAALAAHASCLHRWADERLAPRLSGREGTYTVVRETLTPMRAHTQALARTSCHNSLTGVKTTYTSHTSFCWWAFHTPISTYGPTWNKKVTWRVGLCCLNSFACMPLRACNCAYMTGSNQPTYWKEGGRESPMPPVLSSGGGSSGWLSVHWDPPSECVLSARTSWRRQRLIW